MMLSKLHIVFSVCAIVTGCASTETRSALLEKSEADIRLADDELQPVRLDERYVQGQGLESRDWAPDLKVTPVRFPRQKVWFTGEELTAVVYEQRDGVLKFNPLPQDELALVIEGVAILTSATGRQHSFHRGEAFAIPKGWSGTWEMSEGLRGIFVMKTHEAPPP